MVSRWNALLSHPSPQKTEINFHLYFDFDLLYSLYSPLYFLLDAQKNRKAGDNNVKTYWEQVLVIQFDSIQF